MFANIVNNLFAAIAELARTMREDVDPKYCTWELDKLILEWEGDLQAFAYSERLPWAQRKKDRAHLRYMKQLRECIHALPA